MERGCQQNDGLVNGEVAWVVDVEGWVLAAPFGVTEAPIRPGPPTPPAPTTATAAAAAAVGPACPGGLAVIPRHRRGVRVLGLWAITREVPGLPAVVAQAAISRAAAAAVVAASIIAAASGLIVGSVSRARLWRRLRRPVPPAVRTPGRGQSERLRLLLLLLHLQGLRLLLPPAAAATAAAAATTVASGSLTTAAGMSSAAAAAAAAAVAAAPSVAAAAASVAALATIAPTTSAKTAAAAAAAPLLLPPRPTVPAATTPTSAAALVAEVGRNVAWHWKPQGAHALTCGLEERRIDGTPTVGCTNGRKFIRAIGGRMTYHRYMY